MAEGNLHKGANPKLFQFARENRKAMTEAEAILWECLRNRRLNNFKFRRQHPIGRYIADFFCLECNLIVEVDGDYHKDVEQTQYDEGRTYELNQLNIKVIRFTNHEVIEKTDSVLKEITKQINSSLQLQSPSPKGEGQG